ncbi:polysaccharide biosynthesis protein [Ketobacter sp. MCCC 1A13808]|uniref:polysaccharide biosynthesis protein n=1 Tax=Ketobacter sp. MCCC 1A13808 TaxID=2602738 RepID=UPI0012EC35F3|nr:nucleoside-diphosphate sugar epimerase/dehydratase [Ketobacter sp. MCCC 1A13808]MVF13166.1 polysaccharide biosynthesis protein [Ketobacter sp. MCCC 1A13808]
MLKKLESMPRNYKRMLLLASDALAIPFAYWLSFNLRLDFKHVGLNEGEWLVVILTTAATMLVFVRTGLYRAVIRYIGIHAGLTVLKGALASAVFMTCLSFLFQVWLPRSVPFVYFVLVLLFVGGGRFFLRHWIFASQNNQRRRVAVYGAGSAGSRVMLSLLNSQEYRPVLFVDDDPERIGRVISGVAVVSRSWFLEQYQKMGIKDVLLAMPGVSRSRRREIIESLSHLPVRVHSIPDLGDLMSGRARLEEIRDVQIEDLLGRDEVAPNKSLMHANIRDKVVLVTGAGGSIGSELCRQILKQKPRNLVLLDQSEFSLYRIHRELEESKAVVPDECALIPILGSVLDQELLGSVLNNFRVQTIYHAAAYKHVPMVEHNLVAGLRNNLFGTANVARLASDAGVEACILVSTDKAVRPTSIMGASKRLAEMVFQVQHSLKNKAKSRTRFGIVRFGNVLGSSGSVIPLFQEQIAKGGPVTVTHADMVRYFMTIPEAAQLVIQAGAMAQGGEVFVLDMGEPVKIAAMARKMIALTGLSVKEGDNDGDIEIAYSGLRPGEKLYEELLIGENDMPTSHPRVMQAQEIMIEAAELDGLLAELQILFDSGDCEAIRDLLMRAPLGYAPQGKVEDLLWKSEMAAALAQEATVKPGRVVALDPRKERLS